MIPREDTDEYLHRHDDYPQTAAAKLFSRSLPLVCPADKSGEG